MKMVQLSEVITPISRINPVSLDSESFTYIDLSSVGADTKSIDAPRQVSSAEAPSRARQIIKTDDVLVSTVRPNLNSVAIVHPRFDSCISSTGFSVLRADTSQLAPRYLYHWVRSPNFVALMIQQSTGANYPAVTDKVVKSSRIPLPTLDEQHRVAAILDKADSIRQKRQQAIAHLDSLTQSVFHSMFLRGAPWNSIPLGSVAHVSSGITKGRKPKAPLSHTAPYLSVANVQEGRLDLSNLKTIDVTDSELVKYRLKRGDLLLTEGGDPDKLGRGTIWNDEVSICLHQNHIFCVRLPDDSPVSAEFLSSFLASPPAKTYFLRSAKQTTGIATINKTQLKQLSVPSPPAHLQIEFANLAAVIQARTRRSENAARIEGSLFASLQSRAFKGEL